MTQNDMPDKLTLHINTGFVQFTPASIDEDTVEYHHEDRYQELVEENERLRAALEEILEFDPADEDVKHMMLMCNPTKSAAVYKIQQIAKQALNKGEDE